MSDDRFIFKPIEIVQDRRLTGVEQDYLCLIGSLQKQGECIASNNWLADYFGVSRQAAQQVIGRLIRKKIIKTCEEKSGGKTVKRTITIIDQVSKQSLLTNSKRNLPSNSKQSLPLVSKRSPSRLASSTCKVSKQHYTHKINNKINNKTKEFSASPCLPDGQASPSNLPEEIRRHIESLGFNGTAKFWLDNLAGFFPHYYIPEADMRHLEMVMIKTYDHDIIIHAFAEQSGQKEPSWTIAGNRMQELQREREKAYV